MSIDLLIFEWVEQIRTPWWDVFMKQFTLLGNWPFLFVACAIMCVFLRSSGNGVKARHFFLNVYGGGLLVVLIKYSVQRLRPELGLVEEIGFSFPSAHAFLSVSFYGFLLFLLWKSTLPLFSRWIGFILLAVMVLLISFSRIYLGVHWFSDVVGGVLLGFVWMVLVLRV